MASAGQGAAEGCDVSASADIRREEELVRIGEQAELARAKEQSSVREVYSSDHAIAFKLAEVTSGVELLKEAANGEAGRSAHPMTRELTRGVLPMPAFGETAIVVA